MYRYYVTPHVMFRRRRLCARNSQTILRVTYRVARAALSSCDWSEEQRDSAYCRNYSRLNAGHVACRISTRNDSGRGHASTLIQEMLEAMTVPRHVHID